MAVPRPTARARPAPARAGPVPSPTGPPHHDLGSVAVEHRQLHGLERRRAETAQHGHDGQRGGEAAGDRRARGNRPPGPWSARPSGAGRAPSGPPTGCAGWTTDPAKRAAPEKASSGPARVSTSLVEPVRGPTTCRSSPTSEARSGDWSTQEVAGADGMGCVAAHQVDAHRRRSGRRWPRWPGRRSWPRLARRTRWPSAPPRSRCSGATAQPSNEPSPALRVPRVEHGGDEHDPQAPGRRSGPTSSPAEVRRQAATSERVADVSQDLRPAAPPARPAGRRAAAAPRAHPIRPPTTKHIRLSTAADCARSSGGQ